MNPHRPTDMRHSNGIPRILALAAFTLSGCVAPPTHEPGLDRVPSPVEIPDPMTGESDEVQVLSAAFEDFLEFNSLTLWTVPDEEPRGPYVLLIDDEFQPYSSTTRKNDLELVGGSRVTLDISKLELLPAEPGPDGGRQTLSRLTSPRFFLFDSDAWESRGYEYDNDLEEAYPEASCYVMPWRPTFTAQGDLALVQFYFGPESHGAKAFYLLRRIDERWIVIGRETVYFA